MKEIETKFRVGSHASTRRELMRRGATLAWKGIEKNAYFDTPMGDLRKRKCQLRLRMLSGYPSMLTLKFAPRREDRRYKIREELKFEMSDARAARRILSRLGYRTTFSYEKFREHWILGRVAIELDILRGDRYVEIEGSKKSIRRLAKAFGLSWENATTESYLDILKRR